MSTLQDIAGLLSTFLKDQADLLHKQALQLETIIGKGVKLTASTSNASTAITVKKKKPIRDPNEPKRPFSAYLLFVADNIGPYKQAHPETLQTDIMTIVAKMWSEVDATEKEKYIKKAAELKEAYQIEHQKYISAKSGAPISKVDSDDDDDSSSDDDGSSDDEDTAPSTNSKQAVKAAVKPIAKVALKVSPAVVQNKAPVAVQAPIITKLPVKPSSKPIPEKPGPTTAGKPAVSVPVPLAKPAVGKMPLQSAEEKSKDKKKKRKHADSDALITAPETTVNESDDSEKKKKKKKKKSKHDDTDDGSN